MFSESNIYPEIYEKNEKFENLLFAIFGYLVVFVVFGIKILSSVDFVFLFHDSAIHASLMALAALSVDLRCHLFTFNAEGSHERVAQHLLLEGSSWQGLHSKEGDLDVGH